MNYKIYIDYQKKTFKADGVTIKEGDVIKIDYLSKADEIKVTVSTPKSSKPKDSKDKEEKS